MPERNKKAQTGDFMPRKLFGMKSPSHTLSKVGPPRANFARWLIFGEGEGRKVHRKEEIGIKSQPTSNRLILAIRNAHLRTMKIQGADGCLTGSRN